MDESGRVERGQQKTKAPPSQVVRPRARAKSAAEFRSDPDFLYVTLHAPDLKETDLRYSVRRRYLLVWSHNERHGEHYFIHFPESVSPDGHDVRLRNGVLDVRVRRKARSAK